MFYISSSSKTLKLRDQGITITPAMQKKMRQARQAAQEYRIFNFEMNGIILKAEVVVKGIFCYALRITSEGEIRCLCRYTDELGAPCFHAVAVLDDAFSKTKNPGWALANPKWYVKIVYDL